MTPKPSSLPGDQGALALAIFTVSEKRVVVLDFGKPVSWFGLTKAHAHALANMLIKHADALPGPVKHLESISVIDYLFRPGSPLLVAGVDDVIECPYPDCGAPCGKGDVSAMGFCRYCGGNIWAHVAKGVAEAEAAECSPEAKDC